MSQAARDKKQPLVRIDITDKAMLDQMTAATGESAPKLLHRAIASLKKELFFGQMNDAYRGLRGNEAIWSQEQAERKLFENASGDGLTFDSADSK